MTARVRRICADFTDEEFAVLVRDIVDATLGFDGSATPAGSERSVMHHPPRDDARAGGRTGTRDEALPAS